MHFVNRDSLGLANDFLSLGFIPEGVDTQLVADSLKASFSDRGSQSQDFQVCTFTLLHIHAEHSFGYLRTKKKKKNFWLSDLFDYCFVYLHITSIMRTL